ncbi:hypothetical protein FRC08_012601 [Ceratobasidium sp. 394]|nr:hypothetical protein FRC08_012601 [Ceratobasidium sp. 394]
MDATVHLAIEEWEAARTLLVDGIQSFLAASIALRAVCVGPSHQVFESRTIEATLITLNSELDALALQECRLRDTRMLLATMRNRSSTLVRINTLPPEILVHIFRLSRIRCVLDGDGDPPSFLWVCSYWRQIAVNTPGLWSHIDITPNTPGGLMKLMLECTQGIPFYLHVYEPRLAGFGIEVTEKMQILAPHIRHVQALNIVSDEDYGDFVGTVLDLWFDNGGTELPKSLTVYRPHSGHLLNFAGEATTARLTGVSSAGAGVWSPFGILHLENVHMGWNNACYRGLTELELSFPSGVVFISPPQFARVLSASPSLTILKLGNLAVIPGGDWSLAAPMALNCLKVLRISNPLELNLVQFLPLISLPASVLEIGVITTSFDDIREALADFFMGTQLTTLYCYSHHAPGSATWLLHLGFTSPRRLDTIVLHGFELYGSPADAASQVPFEPVLPTHQTTVILLECRIEPATLINLIAKHRIRDLHLERCVSTWQGTVQDFRARLLEIYPDLQCSISDVDSTHGIGCRTTFGRPVVQ